MLSSTEVKKFLFTKNINSILSKAEDNANNDPEFTSEKRPSDAVVTQSFETSSDENEDYQLE